MPYTSDPAERTILAGFQRAVNDLACNVLTIESTDAGYFELARLQYRFWEVQLAYLSRLGHLFSIGRSELFRQEMAALIQLAADAVPDYPELVDWDAELGQYLDGAA